jgi:methylation protein EvaC
MDRGTVSTRVPTCRICGGPVRECLDFGRQPVSNAFLAPDALDDEVFFRLAVGFCTVCTMVQQIDEFPRDRMFRADYPYRSSGSSVMRAHFEQVSTRLLENELADQNSFAVEIGCNDGIMLEVISKAGVRHLGVDPSAAAAEVAMKKGIEVLIDFFDPTTARAIRAGSGPADVIFSANCISHIASIDSTFRGVDALLAPNGVFILEERYLGDIIGNNYFDQIYDEHFYLFAAHSMRTLVAHFGFELVDVERLPVHGGSVRWTLTRPGVRRPTAAVRELLAQEHGLGLADVATFMRFSANIERVRQNLVNLLRDLSTAGARVVGYGATSRSATVTNYCGIGPDLVPFVCDSTPEKQGLLTPGSHIPVHSPDAFAEPYPDYALLFAWNHAEEILEKEYDFRAQGGKWILYVPDVHIV